MAGENEISAASVDAALPAPRPCVGATHGRGPWALSRRCRTDARAASSPPDVGRLDAGDHPEHDKIVEEIGALADDRLDLSVHGIDDDLDGLFGELLCRLAAAGP